MQRRTIFSIITFVSFVLVVIVVILLAQGNRFNWATNELYGTGYIEVESEPRGAAIYVDDQRKGTTNGTVTNLRPGQYQVRVELNGYNKWTQQVTVEEGRVVNLLSFLIPINPSLAPITSVPTAGAVLSPDGQKLAYRVTEGTSAGIWLLDLSSQPFGLGRQPTQILGDTTVNAYSAGTLQWSANSQQLMIKLDNGLSANTFVVGLNGQNVQDVSSSREELLTSWQAEQQANLQRLAESLPAEGKALAIAQGDRVVWSPDKLKFIGYDEANGQRSYFVYNKEDNRRHATMTAAADQAVVRWFADSNHLIVLQKEQPTATTGKVQFMGMDGSNKVQVFSGTLIDDALFSFLDGSKLVILTTFNPQEPAHYLYSINLR